MFSKGYNNLQVIIETQYGILSQLIYDIDNHYQKNLQQFQEEILRISKENSDGDYEVYLSILHSFDDEKERQASLCKEARKILFCSIFSYYESMLNEIARYYEVYSKSQQVKQLYNAIAKEYHIRYSETLDVDVQEINNFYRLLRNHFMHGSLSDEEVYRTRLYYCINATKGVVLYGDWSIDITESTFLVQALESVKKALTIIENAFSEKVSNDWGILKRAKEIVSEAIKLYPPEYPGAENEFPPYCSLKVHTLLVQAEQMYILLAKRENPEAQMLLADLYLSFDEMRNKKKGIFWLKKSVNQGYKPAIQMMKDFNLRIEAVHISNNITHLSAQSFKGCKTLKKITFDESSALRVIGCEAFMNCKNVSKLQIPQTVCQIGDSAFAGMDNLVEIVLPSKLQILTKFTFSCCYNLIKIILPTSIEIIDDDAFFDSRIEEIAIPSSVKRLGIACFCHCINLKSISLSNSIIEIEDRTFEHCKALAFIEIPKRVEKIGSKAFYGCENLKTIKFQGRVSIVEDDAFKDCAIETVIVNSSISDYYKQIFPISKILEIDE